MFDAVNSIERRYRPYLVQLPANAATSKEAAAAAAAATVLATIRCEDGGSNERSSRELSCVAAGWFGESGGDQAGRGCCCKIVAARADDGCDAPDDYRPQTTPGVYVPTSVMRGPMWPNAKPFAMEVHPNSGQVRRLRSIAGMGKGLQ